MKRKIKLISILSIIINLLFNSTIFADNTIYSEGSLKYRINGDETVTIVEYYGDDKEVKIPMNMGRFIVTEIAPGAFKGSDIEEVKIPDTITSIDEDVFDNINDINIKYFDINDEIVEAEIPIIYHASNDNKEIDKDQKEESQIINEENNNSEITEIEITEEEIIKEETKEIIENISEEDSTNISIDLNKQDNLNPGEFRSSVSLTSGGYLLIIAIILVVLIGIVLIIKKKKNKSK